MVLSKRRGKNNFRLAKNKCASSRRKGGAKFVLKGYYSRVWIGSSFGKLITLHVCFFQEFVSALQNRVSFLVNVEIFTVLQSPEARSMCGKVWPLVKQVSDFRLEKESHVHFHGEETTCIFLKKYNFVDGCQFLLV